MDTRNKSLLVSFGGQGVGAVDTYIDALIQEALPLNIIVVTGKNLQLQQRLSRKYSHNHPNTKVIILGFVHNMNELILAADFCFIKPGPATSIEMISLRKPLLLYEYSSYHERSNIGYCTKNGVGVYIGKSSARLVAAVKSLLDKAEYERIQRNFDAMHLDNGADDIARTVAAIAESQIFR